MNEVQQEAQQTVVMGLKYADQLLIAHETEKSR